MEEISESTGIYTDRETVREAEKESYSQYIECNIKYIIY
jgi:hypothetical protein